MSDDEQEDRSQEYECVNAGCTSDERTFEAAPEDWFADRGLDTPKNCESCREWIEEQKDIGSITATCHFCGYVRVITASYRISYHRNYGNWDEHWDREKDFQICRLCTEFPGRRHKLIYLKAKKQYKEHPEMLRQADEDYLARADGQRLLMEHLRTNGIRSTPKRFDVPESMLFYRGIPTPPELVYKDGENQLTHILQERHEWLQKFGTENPGTILNVAHRIAVSTEQHLLQFASKNGKVAKYDPKQEVVVIIRSSSESPTGNLIVTAFPADPEYVRDQLNEHRWTHSD